MSNFYIDENILFYAFRYCLGRTTYVVADCVDQLKRNWWLLSDKTKSIIIKEIKEAIVENRAGQDNDIEEWIKLIK